MLSGYHMHLIMCQVQHHVQFRLHTATQQAAIVGVHGAVEHCHRVCWSSLHQQEGHGVVESVLSGQFSDNLQGKTKHTANRNLDDYVAEQTSGAQETQEIMTIPMQFGEQNNMLMKSIASLNPEASSFLDPDKVKPLRSLAGTMHVDANFTGAQLLILKHTDSCTLTDEGKWTLLSNFHMATESINKQNVFSQ